MDLERIKLKGNTVCLEPIELEHLEGLIHAGRDQSIWEWVTFQLSDPAVAERFVKHVSTMPDNGEGLGYAIRCNESGSIIGGTGYWHVDHVNQKLEIGGSWITPDKQRSGANTETKYLMLRNAFEKLDCKRVGFSVDTKNLKSIKAITRIGATKEGVLRSDMNLHGGRDRDSAVFSIIKSEWPSIKARLESLLLEHTN